MKYQGKKLTFKRVGGDKDVIIVGECVSYYRSGFHKYWEVIDDETGRKVCLNTSRDELLEIEGKKI